MEPQAITHGNGLLLEQLRNQGKALRGICLVGFGKGDADKHRAGTVRGQGLCMGGSSFVLGCGAAVVAAGCHQHVQPLVGGLQGSEGVLGTKQGRPAAIGADGRGQLARQHSGQRRGGIGAGKNGWRVHAVEAKERACGHSAFAESVAFGGLVNSVRWSHLQCGGFRRRRP